ncbi:MAG: CPBP family intramembrane metalloprotease [Alistipes sp.]|nr:CPBP family intramembrane metalloprotease [Candidatus Alistipes equi]
MSIKYSSYPAFWDLLALIVIFAFCQAVVVVLAKLTGFLPEFTNIEELEQSVTASVRRGQSLAVVYPLGMIFSIFAIMAYIKGRGCRLKRPSFSLRGFDPMITFLGLFWLFSTGIIIEPICEMLPSANYDAIGLGGWACINVVVAAPVLEEILFRGIILESFINRCRTWIAILCSSIIFGVLHGLNGQACMAIVVGILFAIIYLKTKSLFSTIILHAVNNAVGFLLISIHKNDYTYHEFIGNDSIYIVVYAISCVVWLLVGWYFVRGLHLLKK